jgi:hypothetical protein
LTDGVFCHVSMDDLAKLIIGARRLVIVAAAGIDEAVASALVLAAQSIGKDNVQVILDVDEENCRAGYGNVDGYSILTDKGIPIRQCAGLRIGFALADDEGFIFGLPPLMVEAPGKLNGCPNAVRVTLEQIKALEAATRPPPRESSNPSSPSRTQAVLSLPSSSSAAEIGRTYVSKIEVKQIEESVRSNPIQDFDLSRIVHVFTAYVQFVELRVDRASLETHTVKLPPELLTLVRDKKTRDRLTAAFKMVSDGSKISGKKIRKAADDIRKRFIRTNSTFGGVILKAKRAQLEAAVDELRAELEKHKEIVRDRFKKEAERSKKELVQAFWRAVRASPPDDLLAQISGPKPTTEEAKTYLAAKLDREFPNVEKLCKDMAVTFITKDVTWETLNSPNFVEWLSSQFRVNKDLRKPFEEYRAARQRFDAAAALRNVSGRRS